MTSPKRARDRIEEPHADPTSHGQARSTAKPTPSKISSALKLLPKRDASFISPMECLAVLRVPKGSEWVYEVKLDGYRAIGMKLANGTLALYSRAGKMLNRTFPDVTEALNALPNSTVIDGEVVALDDAGRPNFNLLSHSQASAPRIRFYVFDLLCFEEQDITGMPLLERRSLLRSMPLKDPIRLLEYFETSAGEMLDVVRQHGLEGVVAKRIDSPYEPGRRSGAWVKHRIAQQQDFIIGGHIPGAHGVDSIIVGYRRGSELIYVGRVRAGLVRASRRKIFQKLQPLTIKTCPFANLPETGRSHWGESLTAEKMKQCVWVNPKLTVRIEFLERTEGGRLRHSRFVRLNG
jgi:DNA ligase D-like protein (predicted ligase)